MDSVNLAIVGSAEPANRFRSWCQAGEVTVTEPADATLVILAPDGDPTAVPEGCVVAICTTGEAVTPRAAALPDPSAGVGLHVVPAYSRNTLVEVVAAETTAQPAVEAVVALVGRLGLTAVTTRDRPGFLLRRLVLPYLNQAIAALDDGVASGADIDRSVELGLGYPVGPLRLVDALGLEAHHAATTAVAGELADPHFVPPALLTRKIAAGLGFHDHQETLT